MYVRDIHLVAWNQCVRRRRCKQLAERSCPTWHQLATTSPRYLRSGNRCTHSHIRHLCCTYMYILCFIQTSLTRARTSVFNLFLRLPIPIFTTSVMLQPNQSSCYHSFSSLSAPTFIYYYLLTASLKLASKFYGQLCASHGHAKSIFYPPCSS